VKVTVKLGAPLSRVVGERQAVLSMPEESSVADVLDELRTRYPDFEAGLNGKGLRPPLDRILYQLFVNAHPVPLEQVAEVRLRDGDRVYLFLPVAGG
jgi:molybdopterin converting factor small subunit